MASRVTFKPGAVRAFATLTARKDVRKTVVEINKLARKIAPGGPYSTGTLKRSIHWDVTTAGYYVRGRSGSDLPYAYLVHEGAGPHKIRPRRPDGHLVFYWRKAGRKVRLREVNHPGQAEQPYLTVPLLLIAPRRGYKVTIY